MSIPYLWSQYKEGMEGIPGGNVDPANCLIVNRKNELLFWNRRGIGLCNLQELVMRKRLCSRFISLKSM